MSISDFIKFVQIEYDKFHSNRNDLYDTLGIFYTVEFEFINNNNLVRLLWHKGWDKFNIMWTFHAKESLKGETVVWSVPRDVPLDAMHDQFSGLGQTLFGDASLHKVSFSEVDEL